MPFNPGNQNNSGQIWGQAIGNAGMLLGQGLDAYAKKQEADKLLLTQAKATENYIKNNADKFGGDDKVSNILAVDPNETPKQRAAKLQNFMENTIFGAKLNEAQQQAAAQQQLAALNAAKVQEANNQQAMMDRLQRIAAFNQATQPMVQGGALPTYSSGVMAPPPTAGYGSAIPRMTPQIQQVPSSGVYSAGAQNAMQQQWRNPLIQTAATLSQIPEPMRNDVTAIAKIQGTSPQPTPAVRNATSVVSAELAAGTLKPQDVPKRYASLLAYGGREPTARPESQPFQMGAAMGDKNGEYIGNITYDQRTGTMQLETPEGKRMPVPAGARPVTATGMNRQVPSINEFRKMKADVTTSEVALRQFDRYLQSVGDANVGLQRLADNFTAGLKTLTNTKGADGKILTPQELAASAAKGELQGLLGANRISVLSGGPLTETDAERIIQRLGGDANAFQNPERVKKAIQELYTDRYQQYNDDVLFHNNAVEDYYGSRGFKKVPQVKFSPKLDAVTTQLMTPQPPTDTASPIDALLQKYK